MKWILFLFGSIALTGCNQTPNDISMELIPVRSTEYYGYIDHKGEYKINQQFRLAFAFSEGLAVVNNSEYKYGFINTEGEYTIPPIYKHVKAFSEGLAVVVRENSMIEYINKNGEIVITLGPQIAHAGSFSEGLAIVIDDKGLYGFIDKKGEVVIPFQYDYASDFSEGLAEVRQKDKKTEKWLTGYIDAKGKLAINFQFEGRDNLAGSSDFSEGLALVSAGGQYGFVNNKGKYIVNPQFKRATQFRGDFATIQQGDLSGYINKKGGIIINPQFKYAGSFYNNDLAPVNSVTDKFGYIDRKGKFVIPPQFERASRFYKDIAIVQLGGKIGLINKKGEIIVNPQFENDLYIEPNIDNSGNFPVSSDYFDLSGILSFILNDASSTHFYGFSANTNFKLLQTKFPNLNLANYTHFSDFQEISTKNIRLMELHFRFQDDLINYEDIYSNEQVYDPVAGGYITRKYFIYTKESINEDAKLGNVNLVFSLKGKAQGKEEQIIEALETSLKRNLGFTTKSEENTDYAIRKQLENVKYKLEITGVKTSSSILVVIDF